ncbi:peptidase S8 [Blomia tropicalis]|nr:peptidase S8 [Blomia tropicalis]
MDVSIGNLDCHYLFSHQHVTKRSTEYSHDHHRILAQDDQVHWVEQQRILVRPKRDNAKSRYRYRNSMPDPIFKDMWYLRKGALGGFDMNVESAWKMGYTGKNVVVTILDDGIQPNHPELAKNYDPLASYDINDNDPDPTPQDNGDNKHGTRCAGEVAAEAYNEYCGVGIAFNASIGGVRMLDGIVTDQVEARAIGHNPNHVDIYSASWGPEDDGKTVDGPGKLAKRAFIDGIKKGRRGKGSIYVWASGNGGRRLDNCNCDGYTNSIYTLSISSATQNGAKPWYLEECSSTLSTTYSSGTPSKDENIYTCDQDTSYFNALSRGERPQKDSLCTRSHTGTSASAPIAAAIIALGLEANPRLSWRDLQHLVILASRYEPLRHEKGWSTNGVGRKVSHKFGYGLLDAETIVRYAEKWTMVPNQRICETPSQNKEREIPAKLRNQLEVSLLTNGCRGSSNEIRYLEHVQAKITLKYQPRGSLKISIISPSGTISHLLYPRPRDNEEISFNAWPFLSVHFWGEKPSGTWRLVIQNDGSKSAIIPGKLFSWSLIFFGTYEKPISYLYNETLRNFPRSTSPATTNVNECMQNGMFKQFESDDCTKRCPLKQWANTDTGMCQPCNNVCDTCFGPSSDNCLSCSSGLFYEYECLTKCPDGWFVEHDLKECLPCSTNCRLCSESANRCTDCRDGLQLDTNTNLCIPEVNIEQLKQHNQSNCYENCKVCTGPKRNDCLICNDDFRLLNGACIDDNCPDGFYLKQTRSECSSCHHSCRTCASPSHVDCLSCFKNSTLINGTCHFCLEGHFMNRETKRCESCHSSCSTCSGPLANDCLTCRSGLFMDNWHCVPCCEPANNQLLQTNLQNEFTDCCQCVSSNGPCTSSLAIDKTRSIEMIGDNVELNSPFSNLLYRLLNHSTAYVILLTLVGFLIFVAYRRKFGNNFNRRKRTATPYNIDYQKLNVNYSRSKNRRQPETIDEQYEPEIDEDEEDEEELTLFEKT